MQRAMGRHPLQFVCVLAGGSKFLRYPLLGGINRKPKHKRNGATHFQSTASQVTQKCFRQNLCASTLKMMLIIEFLFLLSGLFLPWVDADFSAKHFRSCVRVTTGLLTFHRWERQTGFERRGAHPKCEVHSYTRKRTRSNRTLIDKTVFGKYFDYMFHVR